MLGRTFKLRVTVILSSPDLQYWSFKLACTRFLKRILTLPCTLEKDS